jgi:CubicO group peptidase (beta-lactamase class C family)
MWGHRRWSDASATLMKPKGKISLLLAPVLLIFALAQTSVHGQGSRPRSASGDAEATADRILLPAMEKKQLVGLVLGVVKDGRVILRKGYGVKSLTAPGAPDADTIFYIGSLSKALTAVGLMRLVESGNVRLGDPAGKYLPALPTDWQAITVGQFMAHQSGIPPMERKLPAFDEMIASAQNAPLTFPPGARQEYNNFNFAVIGKLIEALSGQPYLQYMRAAVFAPLGMTRSGSGLEDANEATSYRPGPPPQPIDHRIKGGEYGIPSGHLQSTLNDLLSFSVGLSGHALLNASTTDQMCKRMQPRFSATPGWFEQPAGGLSVVTKNGAGQGFHSILSFVANKGHAVVMIWTGQKPKDNSLARETRELLNQICGVPIGRDANTGDDDP